MSISYILVIVAITLVTLMITFLQMQEDDSTKTTTDSMHHIDIDSFDEWCEKHPEVYWPKKHGITIPKWEDWLANQEELDEMFGPLDYKSNPDDWGDDVDHFMAQQDAEAIIQQLPAADQPAARKAVETIGVYDFVNAARGGDAAPLMKIPGIGVKRAAKIIAAAADADAIAETVDEDDAAYYEYCQSSYVKAMREVF